MNYRLFFYPALCILTLGIGCTSKTIGTKSEERYSEDLNQYHLHYKDSLNSLGVENPENNETVVPNPERKTIQGNIETKYAITDSVNDFLAKETILHKQDNEYQGLTIQVYSGLDRDKATEAKNKVYEAMPDAQPRMVYEQPNYKVRVGKYTDRLEAQKDYAALRQAFPLVLMVPERFKVVD